ncbi:vitamin B12 ABC transporter [Fusibacter sp. 3D3]|nr:vitamin B12 ABC transporter [Fusibacter sp. 3D3]
MIILVGFISMFLGRYMINPFKVVQILYSNMTGNALDTVQNTIVWDIRLPRIFLTMMVGAGLSVAGAAFQGCFHNPLVSPDLLGVSAGAGFGAALGILYTSDVFGITPLLSFGFGVLAVSASWLLSRIKKNSTILSLILSGIIISSVFHSLISLIKFVADTDSQLPAITYWLMGSFANTSWDNVIFAVLPISVGIFILFSLRWHINILTLGDEEAKTLGVKPEKIRIIIILASTMITASAVMMTGIIGWVGLIIPNLCRMIIGSDYKYLMPLACILGALFMMSIDIIARVITPAEIPIGVLSALIGAPFFAIVYSKTKGI